MKKMMNELKHIVKIATKELIIKFSSSIAIRGLLLIIPIILSTIINNITNGSYQKAIMYSVILIVIALIYRLSEGINQIFYYKLYNKIFSHYNSLAIDKTNDNSIFSLSRFSLGQYTNTVITDVDIMTTYITAGVIRIVQIIEFFVIYIYFFILDKYLFLAALVLSIVMLIIAIISGNKIQILNEKRKTELDKLSASTHEYFLGIKEVKSFNIFDIISSKTKKNTTNYLDANAKYNIKFNFNNHLFLGVFELFRMLSVIYGIYLVSTGNIQVGVVLIIYNYYQKLIDNFSTILTINVETRNYNVSLKRFYHLLEYSKSHKKDDSLTLNSIEGTIKFNNILYGYRENPTLDKVSFEINKNSINVITGKVGKSAIGIYELLLKLNRAHEGTITIDNIDINKIRDNEYYNLISSSEGEPAFFNMSIKDNLGIIEDNFNEIKEICTDLGINDNIMALNKGYETIMDNNIPLTQTDKQLLSIARVLLKDSKIMLFDESITSFDDKTQKKIFKVLNNLKKDHTILIISQNEQSYNIADKIIVFDKKKIIEQGTKDELLENKGFFYRIVEDK